MSEIQQKPVVVTCYESVGEDGYLHHHSQMPYSAVERQIKAVLDTVRNEDGQTASELAEWFSGYTKDGNLLYQDADWPAGEVIVTAKRGHSEGWILQILVRPPGDWGFFDALAVKYLSDPDLVYEAAKVLSIAFDEGLYAHVEPPSAQDGAKEVA